MIILDMKQSCVCTTRLSSLPMTNIQELAEAWHAAECDIDAGGACILHSDIKDAWIAGYQAASQPLFPTDRVTQLTPDHRPTFNHTIVAIAPGIDAMGRHIVIMNVLMGGQKDQYRLLPSVARSMSDSLDLAADYSDGIIDSDTYNARVDLFRDGVPNHNDA